MYVKKVTSVAIGLGIVVALSGCVHHSRVVRHVEREPYRPRRPKIHTVAVVREVHHERPRVNKRETKREVHRETKHDGPRITPKHREETKRTHHKAHEGKKRVTDKKKNGTPDSRGQGASRRDKPFNYAQDKSVRNDRNGRSEEVKNRHEQRQRPKRDEEHSVREKPQKKGKKADSKPDKKRAEPKTRNHEPKGEETRPERSEKDRRRG